MQLIDSLEQRFGKFAIQNLTNYIIGGEILAYIIGYTHPTLARFFPLSGYYLLHGQIWRIISFLFTPTIDNPIFFAIGMYLFYLYGNALERKWGEFHSLCYILVSWIGVIILSLIFPQQTITNVYIFLSIFLAFAYLFPNFTLMIFFIIPVKVKWIALLAWVGILLTVLFGAIPDKLLAIVSISNFILFFGSEIVTTGKWQSRSVYHRSKKIMESKKPNHICAQCGSNEQKDDKIFYYCSQCYPTTCYCEDHINNHTHKRVVN